MLERLSDAFARDELGLEEFEARVDGAYQAASEQDLYALLKDLSAAPSAPRAELVAVSAPGAARPRVLALLGSVERHGRFKLRSGSRATAVLGNLELDLRDVVLDAGLTELHVRAVLGNVELIVPPELCVECEGNGILASFASLTRLPAEAVQEGPVLRVLGSAVLGNVEIRTLPRGVPLGARGGKALPAARKEAG